MHLYILSISVIFPSISEGFGKYIYYTSVKEVSKDTWKLLVGILDNFLEELLYY